MAVKLASLKNDPKYRKVRDMVVVGNDTITIYEPTAEDEDRDHRRVKRLHWPKTIW